MAHVFTGVPSQAEVVAAWEPRLRAQGEVCQKCTSMHAKRALAAGVLETVLHDVVETSKAYAAGDFILHGTEGERYALSADQFESRYDMDQTSPAETAALREEGFHLYRARGKVWAHRLTESERASSFPESSFMAAWGAPMLVEAGDILACPHPDGGEIYRIEATAFSHTYARVPHAPEESPPPPPPPEETEPPPPPTGDALPPPADSPRVRRFGRFDRVICNLGSRGWVAGSVQDLDVVDPEGYRPPIPYVVELDAPHSRLISVPRDASACVVPEVCFGRLPGARYLTASCLVRRARTHTRRRRLVPIPLPLHPPPGHRSCTRRRRRGRRCASLAASASRAPSTTTSASLPRGWPGRCAHCGSNSAALRSSRSVERSAVRSLCWWLRMR